MDSIPLLTACDTVRLLWQVVGLKQLKERSWQKRSPAITWILRSQHGDWTKLFQLVFQCNPFLMNLLSYIKQRKEKKQRGHFLGSSLVKKEYNWTYEDLSTIWLKDGWTGRYHVYSWWLVKGSFTFCNLLTLFWRWWNGTDQHIHLPQLQSHLRF